MSTRVQRGQGRGRSELADALGPQVGVPLELVPRFVQRELCHLVDLISALKQLASCLVTQVVKAKILDAEHVAGPGEGGADALGIVRKDAGARPRLVLDDRPGLRGIFEAPMVAVLGRRMLRVAHKAGPSGRVIVAPLQSTDLRFASRRGDGEIHNRLHRDLCAPIAARKVLSQACELVPCRAPRTPTRLTDEAQLPAGT